MGFRGGREHLSKVSRPLPSARLWSRAPIDPPTRLVSTNESHLEELPALRVLRFRPNPLVPSFVSSFSRRLAKCTRRFIMRASGN